MKRLTAVLDAVGKFFDAVGALPPGVAAAETTIFVGALIAVSQYPATGTEREAIVGGVVAILATGVALERIVKAFKSGGK